jgi:hypothetical protein
VVLGAVDVDHVDPVETEPVEAGVETVPHTVAGVVAFAGEVVRDGESAGREIGSGG